MSCLKLNKFLPAKRAWRVFARRVQTNLHRLHPSRTIKKKPSKTKKKGKAGSCCWSGFCIQPKIFKLKKAKPKSSHLYQSYYFQKRPSPVYIDQLFIEPAETYNIQEFSLQPTLRAAAAAKQPYKEKEKETCLPTFQAAESGSSTNSADDMWESLVLASPQMNGINERAEEFINKFRADMMLQERLARRL